MENKSTLITTKTNLPPNLQGPINGQVKLHVPFITLHKSITKTECYLVKTRWWGDNCYTIFKPLSYGSSQKDLKTIAIYNVHCSLEMILSYFKDMNQLKFEIVSNFGQAAHTLGLVQVNLESVKFGAPLAGLYPIKSDEKIIGEMFISLSLENFKTGPVQESKDDLSKTQPKVASLRKDTNNVLNQILAKAKDLRSCLQAIGGSHDYISNNVKAQLSISQLLLEKSDTSLKKSVDSYRDYSDCEEDSLPDDSVLNSVIYNSNCRVSRKESIHTQTQDLTLAKETLCKSVETQCDQNSAQSGNESFFGTKLNGKCDSTSDPGFSTTVESCWEKLRDYSYLKVTVDALHIGSTYQNSGWIFSVELQIPWVGRDSAISWNNKGHRTYSDFSIFHLLSDKRKDRAVIFKQDRVLPYYYSSNLIGPQLSKSVHFIVEARNAHKRMMRKLGKAQIILSDVLKNNMKLQSNLNLVSDEMVTHNSNSIKVVVEFLKISQKISSAEYVESNVIEAKDPLVVAIAPIATKKFPKKYQLNKPSERFYESVTDSKISSLETDKVNYEAQTSNVREINEILNGSILKPSVGNVGIILCVDRAFRLPIVYDSQRNLYFPPSTYVSCKLNDVIVSTNVIRKSTQPIWNFTHRALMENQNFLVFKIHLVEEETADPNRDKILGFSTVDLRPLVLSTNHLCNSYLINNEFGDDCGELKLFIWPLRSTDTNVHLTCEEKLRNIQKSSATKSKNESVTSSAKLKVNEFLRKSVTTNFKT